MIINYKSKSIMISKGQFEVGAYGRYSYRGEILHMCDSYIYGNSEEEVISQIKSYIDKEEA